jgi:hypothetical protein
MMASVWISPSSNSCTSERRRVRRVEGKAVGLDAVVMVLLEVSVGRQYVVESVRLCKDAMLTFVLRAADFASQVCLAAGVGFEKVAAVGTEDEGSNGGHLCGVKSEHVKERLSEV